MAHDTRITGDRETRLVGVEVPKDFGLDDPSLKWVELKGASQDGFLDPVSYNMALVLYWPTIVKGVSTPGKGTVVLVRERASFHLRPPTLNPPTPGRFPKHTPIRRGSPLPETTDPLRRR